MPAYDTELIYMLSHSSSARRRSAAKKLRKIKETSAGPDLLAALKNEMKNSRTWETQYHMIMALSDCSYTDSLTFLYELADSQPSTPMVNIAVGDAITNLEYLKSGHLEKIRYWLTKRNNELLEGAMRAIAMNKIVPESNDISALIDYVFNSKNEGLVFWLAAACPGWPLNLTKPFLEFCLAKSATDDIKKAAEAALLNKYLKWRPL
jgi:hypothetical protein